MKLNTSLVFANENQRHSKPKPVAVIKATSLKSTLPEPIQPETISPAPVIENINSEIVIGLKAELATLQRKLGTQTAYRVADPDKKLRKENDRLAEEFLKGNLPRGRLFILAVWSANSGNLHRGDDKRMQAPDTIQCGQL